MISRLSLSYKGCLLFCITCGGEWRLRDINTFWDCYTFFCLVKFYGFMYAQTYFQIQTKFKLSNETEKETGSLPCFLTALYSLIVPDCCAFSKTNSFFCTVLFLKIVTELFSKLTGSFKVGF